MLSNIVSLINECNKIYNSVSCTDCQINYSNQRLPICYNNETRYLLLESTPEVCDGELYFHQPGWLSSLKVMRIEPMLKVSYSSCTTYHIWGADSSSICCWYTTCYYDINASIIDNCSCHYPAYIDLCCPMCFYRYCGTTKVCIGNLPGNDSNSVILSNFEITTNDHSYLDICQHFQATNSGTTYCRMPLNYKKPSSSYDGACCTASYTCCVSLSYY